MLDQPGPAATDNDTEFSLTIEDVAERYAAAGHPRTLRTLQRYCASGHLDCRKAATALGDKYFVTSQSVARHISQIAELSALQLGPTDRGLSRPRAEHPSLFSDTDNHRPDAASRDGSHAQHSHQNSLRDDASARQSPTSPADMSRPPATGESGVSPLVGQREIEIARLHDDIGFLRGQIATKDEQIAALLERDKETNFLVRGLQQMLSPLLAGPQARQHDNQRPTS